MNGYQTSWNYSNIATSLAAYLVEVATGTPFKEYVVTKVLQPLGMTQTAYEVLLDALLPDGKVSAALAENQGAMVCYS